MNINLSAHFTLEEFTRSQTASSRHIDNTPSHQVIDNLTKLAATMEKVRAILGHPIQILSGYRSPALNNAVGGVSTSAHVTGLACDFVCPAYGNVRDIARKLHESGIPHDQIIEENFNPDTGAGWVHLSIDPQNRRQYLKATKGANGKMTYTVII